MDRASLVVCLGALLAGVAVAAAAFPFAAMPAAALHDLRRGVAAETLPDLELGGGFGRVAVVDLLGYWLDHPPAAAPAGATPAARHFGGC